MKRRSSHFRRPISIDHLDISRLSKLLTDANINSAATQVRSYCLDIGCEFASITNGHEWIFFKIFERNKKWTSLNAFVIRSLDFFEHDYVRARNSLSYRAVTDRLSLISILTSISTQDRSIYYAKDRIPSYSHPIKANRLASTLRPIVNHYFGVIADDEPDFMNRCYVSQRDYEQTLEGVQSLIEDSLSPYFASYRVPQLEDTGKGGSTWRSPDERSQARQEGRGSRSFRWKGSGKINLH